MYEHKTNHSKKRHKRSNPMKCKRIKDILDAGYDIIYEKHEMFNEDDAYAMEKRLIESLGKIIDGTGILTNIADGGLGGNPPKTPVDQYTLGGDLIATYSSIIDASERTGINGPNISSSITNRNTKNKSAGGFVWTYRGAAFAPPSPKTNCKTVFQFDTTGSITAEYHSSAQASTVSGVDRAGIIKCCNSTQRTAGGWRWSYDAVAPKNTRKSESLTKRVCRLSLSGGITIEYESLKDASIANNIPVSGISTCCHNQTKSRGGFRWKFI